MGPCTNPGTSREVNEARGPHTCSRPCAFEEKNEKKTRNPAAPKAHHEIHSSQATVTTSVRRATKHAPRVSPYSPACIDPGFVEIGLVQLSQSVKTTNVKHVRRQTNGQTDQLNNGTLYATRYEEAFSPRGKKRPRSLRSLGLASLQPITCENTNVLPTIQWLGTVGIYNE